MGLFSKIKAGLLKTRQAMMSKLSKLLHSFTKIDEDLFEQLEETLIMSDVGVDTSLEICDRLRKMIKEQGITDPKEIMRLIHEIVSDMMGEDQGLDLSTTPSVIMVIGVNGAGKTTTIGKLCHKLKGEGKKVLVAAADTFRAAAIDQLQVWTERAGVDIVKHAEGSDAAAVVYDAITAAKARHCDVVIVDTAGRLHNKKNLMDELAKINRIVAGQAEGCAREILLVLDATTGQNAVNQAKLFSEVADITGIVLTKLDGTAKGGIVISIKNELGIPVKLVGLGEKIDDLQDFNSRDFVNALFGDEVLDGEVNLDEDEAYGEDSDEEVSETYDDSEQTESEDVSDAEEQAEEVSGADDETEAVSETDDEAEDEQTEETSVASEEAEDETSDEEEMLATAYRPSSTPNAVLYMKPKPSAEENEVKDPLFASLSSVDTVDEDVYETVAVADEDSEDISETAISAEDTSGEVQEENAAESEDAVEETEEPEKKKGFFSRLFGKKKKDKNKDKDDEE